MRKWTISLTHHTASRKLSDALIKRHPTAGGYEEERRKRHKNENLRNEESHQTVILRGQIVMKMMCCYAARYSVDENIREGPAMVLEYIEAKTLKQLADAQRDGTLFF